MAADVMMGHDANCADWLKYARSLPEPEKKTAAVAAAAPAEGGRDAAAERAAREARRAARRGADAA